MSQKQISRLGNNDFASVTAVFDEASPSKILVTSVDYVGLSTLIGVWRSDVEICYEFASFNKLYVYAPNRANECVRSADPELSTKYAYFINPDVGAWNMLISSNDSEFVGELNILSSNRVEILLFDSQTDAILGTVVLRR